MSVIAEAYDYYFVELGDPRVKDWYFMGGPIPITIILVSYWFFIKSLGPRMMKNREPFDLKNSLIIYNAIQIIYSLYLFVEGVLAISWADRNWTCEPIDYTMNPKSLRLTKLIYVYFLAKLTELIDTVFFVLRKKDNQSTFLHMYHHTGTPIVTWIMAKYIGSGHMTPIVVINSFVHVPMYSYYLLVALGPQYRKYTWFKPYLTIFQLSHLIGGCLWCAYNLLFCQQPKLPTLLAICNLFFQTILFSRFYYSAYIKKPKSSQKKVE